MCFASVFSINDRPWGASSCELEDHGCRSSDIPFVGTEIVREQLYQLDVPKSMGPDGIHARVLKELADVTAGPLSIIYQRSWESGEVPADWKLASLIPDICACSPISLFSRPIRPSSDIYLCKYTLHEEEVLQPWKLLEG